MNKGMLEPSIGVEIGEYYLRNLLPRARPDVC